MYRCRRLVAVVLSLAVMASAFIITASADSDEYNAIVLNINGTGYTISDGVGHMVLIGAGQSITLNVNRIAPLSYSLKANQSLALNFDIRVYVSYDSTNYNDRVSNYYPFYSNNNQYYNSSHGYLNIVTHRDGDLWFEPDRMNKSNFGYHGSFILYDSSAIDLNLTSTWTNNSATELRVYFMFENVDVHTSENYNLSNYILPAIQGVATSISNLSSDILGVKTSIDYANNKWFTESYTYTQITYDQDGNASAFNVMGNWVTAVLGSLKSLVAPIKNQVNQEQKAKDAGAYDALDDAYDHSSFLSFLDFTSFADFGDYDSDDLDEINDDSYSVWFSNMTKNDLDTVAQTRGQDDDFISYYEDHMAEIENSVGSMLGGGD